MKPKRVNVRDILALARKQIEGLRGRSEVAKGLPFSVGAIEALLGQILELDGKQELAKKVVLPLTVEIQAKAFELQERVTRNIAAIQARFGKYAQEVEVAGGTPLRGTHRPPKRASGSPEAVRDVA